MTLKIQHEKYMKVEKKAVFRVPNPITPDYQGHYDKAYIRPNHLILQSNPETSLHNQYYRT